MPNVRAFRSGNWSDTNPATSPWGTGGVLYAPAANDDVFANNFAITIDQNVSVLSITNGSASSRLWKDGGTAAITANASGFFNVATSQSITANVQAATTGSPTIRFTAPSSASTLNFTGNITGSNSSIYYDCGLDNRSPGTINVVNSNITAGGSFDSLAVANSGLGNINFSTCVLNGGGGSSNTATHRGFAVSNMNSGGVYFYTCTVNGGGSSFYNSTITNIGGGILYFQGSVTASSGSPAIANRSGSCEVTGTITSDNGCHAIVASPNQINCISGNLIHSSQGTPILGVYSTSGNQIVRFYLKTQPTASYTQYPLNGLSALSFVRYYTADNALGQANPTDVRSGVSYASGNLTGRLTVPARGSVALSVNYGPSMPFTATRSGTTATAILAYSYPLVVGDEFKVTGASNSEWNSTYTIASVVSGTEITFAVPNTHSATAGAGATMQTTGTAVLDPTAVASAVWGAATRSITGGTVDTLTNAPDVPTESEIATAVRAELATELARIDAPISGAGNAPSASTVATAVRSELSTELARVDQAISTRLASASYTAPANSAIAAIQAKTDNLPASPAATGDIPTAAQNATAVWSKPANDLTVADSIGERAKQQSTVAITGAQLAAALS